MDILLRVLLIICSLISFLMCIIRIKQAKLKVTQSAMWMIGSLVLIFMSVFSDVIEWFSRLLGFVSAVNFVFLVIIGFLVVQAFASNIRISQLHDKIKDLNHYIAINELEHSSEQQLEDKNHQPNHNHHHI